MPYGEGFLTLNVDCTVLKPSASFPRRPLSNLLRESLDSPIAERRIEELKGEKAVILVDDYTRSTPAKEIIPEVAERLKKVVKGDLSILVASGTHRRMSEKELEAKLGEAYNVFPVAQHNPDDNLLFLGETSRGTPVWVNSEAVKADIIVSIGSVAPHNIHGWSGGAKIIVPGVAGRVTIASNHRLAEHPLTRFGVAESPARLDAEEAAGKLSKLFSINIVRGCDASVIHVSSGNFVAAHRMAVKAAVEAVGVKAPWSADVVVASSHPYDNDLWQAGKALFSAANIAEEGATIILVSPLREGVCTHYPEFEDFLALPVEELRRKMSTNPLEATIALQVKRLQERFNCVLVSKGVGEDQAERIGFKWRPSLQGAVDEVADSGSKVAVIPNALIYPYR